MYHEGAATSHLDTVRLLALSLPGNAATETVPVCVYGRDEFALHFHLLHTSFLIG
jgi:hypothetical protein